MNQAIPLARNSIVLSSGDYHGSCVVGLKHITVQVTWCADQVAVKLVPAQCTSDTLVQLQLTRVSRYSNGVYLFDMLHVLRFIVECNLCDRFSGFIPLELRVCLRTVVQFNSNLSKAFTGREDWQMRLQCHAVVTGYRQGQCRINMIPNIVSTIEF